ETRIAAIWLALRIPSHTPDSPSLHCGELCAIGDYQSFNKPLLSNIINSRLLNIISTCVTSNEIS
ncbi:unnamed protein product, partial [Nesidiocoris tenuis]